MKNTQKSAHLLKLSLLSLALSFGFSYQARAELPADLSPPQYAAGAIVGTFVPYVAFSSEASQKWHPGFFLVPALGLGQLIQGRYMKTGLIVTGSELLFGALFLSYLDDVFSDTGRGNDTFGEIYLAGLIFARAFEVFDLWAGPHLYPERGLVSATIYPDPKRGIMGNVVYRF